MSKYTMLFAEYLERGGDLPASFGLIVGFGDLFKKHYFDKEIGFETELIFRMKLEEKADLYMQLYADKIQRLATAWGVFDSPAKVRYTEEYKTFTGGAQHAETTELPFDSDTAEPSLLNDSNEYENKDTRATTERETGETHDEAIKSLDFLNSKVRNLLTDLLQEFKNCFMGVY